MTPNTNNKDWHLKRQIVFLLIGLLPEAIMESTLIPLFPFLVKKQLPEKEDIGYFVGLLASAFYLPLCVSNIFWGFTSDLYGRKRVLLLGMVVSLSTSLTLGLSQLYTLTVCCRIVAGLFGANSTIVKGMIGDISKEDDGLRSLGYAWYGSVYGISGILGPLLIGWIGDPASLYPNVFSQDGFFGVHPYILICLLSASIALIGIYLTTFHIIERKRDVYQEISSEDLDLSSASAASSTTAQQRKILPQISEGNAKVRRKEIHLAGSASSSSSISPSRRSPSDEHVLGGSIATSSSSSSSSSSPSNSSISSFKIRDWKTMAPIFLYCCIAYLNSTYMTVLPLFFSAKPENGGLGMDSGATGVALSVIACSKLFVQILFFEKIVVRMKSSSRTFLFGMCTFIPGLILVPFLAVFPASLLRSLILFCIMALFGLCESLSFLSVIMLITESQRVENLGKAHGLAATIAAVTRTLAPTVAGSFWEWGVALNWNGLVFIFASMVALLGVISSSGA